MACRKAAYNALTEMSEYMEKQAEHAAAAKAKLEREIRQTWTPSNVLEHCCIPWLADGGEVVGHRTNNHVTRGCSGGCGKEHAKITLDFVAKSNGGKDETKGATATLSHALDPFVNYFEHLCQQGKATKIESPNKLRLPTYSLNGFLQQHVQDLQNSDRFGYHLVKVSPTAFASSKRAHERMVQEQEDMERVAKKARTTESKKSGGETALFDLVMQICYGNGTFLNHLDLLEISWMRLSGNRTMSKIAAKLAAERLRTTQLRFKANLFASVRFPIISETRWRIDGISMKASNELNRFVTAEEDRQETWERLRFFRPGDPWARRSVNLKLYLRGHTRSHSSMQLPESSCLFSNDLEIGRYTFDILDIPEEEVVNTREADSGQMPDSKVSVKFRTGMSQVEDKNYESDRRCTISELSLNLGFHHLLGIYARKKLPLAKKEMLDIKQKRPVTRAEKEYVKAIARAAREAPGNGERTFAGLDGW